MICKYQKGAGVRAHRDNDYNALSDTIISMNLVGRAVFSVKYNGEWHHIQLEEGDVVVFDRNLLHTAGGATGTRVNATVRYAAPGAAPVFKRKS